MSAVDKRIYPRLSCFSTQQIFLLSPPDFFNRKPVMARNISATGFGFRAPGTFREGQDVLVLLDDERLEDLRENRAQVVKMGRYVLARIVWVTPGVGVSGTLCEVGCRFVGQEEKNPQLLEVFTQAINRDTLERLSS